MRRSAQTEGCIATLRRRYPATPGRALPYASVGDDAGIVPEPCGGGRPQAAGENARPTLRPGTGGDTKAAAFCQARRRADASIGPYAGGRAATPGAVARIRYIVGRAFTPAGEVCGGVMLWFCVSAAPQGWGGLRQPGRVLAGRGAAPLSRLMPLPVCGIHIMRRTLKRACILRPLHLLRLAVSAAGGARLRSPLQGSLLGGSRLRSLPCKGRWMRRKAQTEGCMAGWR